MALKSSAAASRGLFRRLFSSASSSPSFRPPAQPLETVAGTLLFCLSLSLSSVIDYSLSTS
ncbi:hypothetical protein TIFTF001_032272 [Ficus carica]|uniref:Uncharacterized protein n=1 Tax=Ficus carica TaxID=3494 RepID=A0AA88DX63_FICCA|nr:hypothetical protein TIFTF001_032272 [Ficus carica]